MSVTRTTGKPSGGATVISAESFDLKYSARVGRWACHHARRGGGWRGGGGGEAGKRQGRRAQAFDAAVGVGESRRGPRACV